MKPWYGARSRPSAVPAVGRDVTVFDTDPDYGAIVRAPRTGEGRDGTVVLHPEQGKYHLEGHRACGVRREAGYAGVFGTVPLG